MITENASAQLGVGIRGGNPSGLTLKKYNGDNAIELSIGRNYWFNGSNWYNKHYDYWYDKHYLSNYDALNLDYVRAYTPFAVQLHFLKHKDFKSTGSADLSGLRYYYGGGLFFGYQRYVYSYYYKLNNDPNWYYMDRKDYAYINLGLDGVLGLEYTFEEVPVSIFLDGTLYLELINRPFLIAGFGGIGVRYNFE